MEGTSHENGRSKFAGTNCSDECPHCKKSVDSRAHRVFDCPAFERVRWHYRDIFMVCGPSRQAWVSRCAVPYKVCFFTDASCLFPAVPDIRVAAAAVVTPAGSFVFQPVWSGLLPTSNQTIQRAEVLAGANCYCVGVESCGHFGQFVLCQHCKASLVLLGLWVFAQVPC